MAGLDSESGPAAERPGNFHMRSVSETAGVGPRHMGYVVLKVESYGGGTAGEGCYPGVVNGQIMGGLMNGRAVSIALRRTLTNQRVPQIADLQNEDKLCRTLPGGYLAFEGVRQESGMLTAQWLNRMGDPDSVVRSGMPAQIAPSYDREGNVRRFKVNGATVYNAYILHMSRSETSDGETGLQSVLVKAMEDKGSALVALAPGGSADAGRRSRRTLMAVAGWRDGNRIPAGEAADCFLARHGEETLRPHFDSGAPADVIPLEIVRLGSRVCESIDAGGKHSVPVSRYMTGGLGARIESSLRRTGPVVAEKLETAFLAQARRRAKESFAAAGWKGVWNSDVAQFFAAAGIELPSVRRYGFAVTTAFLRPYAAGSGDLYLAKARPLSAALPRDAVPTPSDPKARDRYYEAVHEAVSRLAELLPDSPSTERESRAAKAKLDASLQNRSGVEAEVNPGESGTGAAFAAGGRRRCEPGTDELMNF